MMLFFFKFQITFTSQNDWMGSALSLDLTGEWRLKKRDKRKTKQKEDKNWKEDMNESSFFKLQRSAEEQNTSKAKVFSARSAVVEEIVKNISFHLLKQRQKTWLTLGPVSPWSPWEKNRKITIVSSYMHTGRGMQQNTATVEQLWQTGLKMNTRVGEGRDSEVICPQTSPGCRHLLHKSFDKPQLESSDGVRWAEKKWKHTCWGIVGPLMRIWSSCSHRRATSMITWREPIFQTSASSVHCNPRSSAWIPLWQMLFTPVALFLWSCLSGQFLLKCKTVRMQSYPLVRVQMTTCVSLLLPALAAPCGRWCLKAGQRFTERENIWLSSSPTEGPVNLLSALTWECAETHELLHNYM